VVDEEKNLEQRIQFLNTMDWSTLHTLMCDAGLLRREKGGRVTVDTERMAAMLALTGVHDIMKHEMLCPTVLPEHAPFHGHAAGDKIRDHDLALAYILQHDPTALPSYAALPDVQRRAVAFTQADLGFNHGWLVQAEAPPGAIFVKFKQLLSKGQVAAPDIAFYFLHWVTDLAGAEPTPLHGAEKFVLKFPTLVLRTLINSMAIVQRLATMTPTALYEEYLQYAWASSPWLGTPPSDHEAIALMRLLAQVQDPEKQQLIRHAILGMIPGARDWLTYEMSLSGVAGEAYGLSPQAVGGPAFLLYYAPAFLRQCCMPRSAPSPRMVELSAAEQARDGLHTIAEIYRAARKLWPLTHKASGDTVTVMVDEIKSCGTRDLHDAYTDGYAWLLVRSGKSSANVRKTPIGELPAQMSTGTCEILRLWRNVERPFTGMELAAAHRLEPQAQPEHGNSLMNLFA